MIVCILGHSFISGLLHHLENRCKQKLAPADVAKTLKVDNLVAQIHMFGQRGAKILDGNYLMPSHLLRSVNPDLVLMQIGSNDLANGSCPLSVASKSIDMAQNILSKIKSAKQVIILSIIPRISKDPGISQEKLNDSIYKCNGYLKNFCDVESSIQFKSLSGFWKNPIMHWSRDGIHPNSHHGREKYIHNIRFIIFDAITRIVNNK